MGLKALKTFLIDFLKFSAIASVVWLTLMIFLDDPIFYAPVPVQHLPEFIYKLFLVMLSILLLLLTIIAIISFFMKNPYVKRKKAIITDGPRDTLPLCYIL